MLMETQKVFTVSIIPFCNRLRKRVIHSFALVYICLSDEIGFPLIISSIYDILEE